MRRALLACLTVLLLLPASACAHDALISHSDTPAELADGSIVAALDAAGSGATGLPTPWCGTRMTVDDTLDAAQAPTTPVVKVVYAYASDQSDRSVAWSDALQGNVASIETFLAEQSGGRRAVAFDMGTSCGPQYVDITVVPLPRPRSAYTSDAAFGTLRDDVLAALGPAVGRRDVLIMADQLGTSTHGLGEVYPGEDEPGPANLHNDGGFSAAIYSVLGSTPGASGWQPTMMLHEITHNLGAVQPSAPHSTPNGHCWDGSDVMCYADGSTGSQPYTPSICPTISGAITQVYDCGHDDYYDPSPAPGSYLDTHWNVYRSVFMAACTDLASACGALTHTLVVPVNTTAPAITGAAQVGATLTVSRGDWTGAPSSYAVTWQRETAPGSWQTLAGTGFDHPVDASDRGLRLRATVTATNADGSAAVTTAPTGTVTVADAASPAPAPAPAPSTTPPPPTVVPAAVLKAQLRVALRARGHLAGTLTVPVTRTVRAVDVRTTAATVAVRAGRWRLKLCASAPGLTRRCVLGARATASHGHVRIAAARLLLGPTTRAVTVTAALVDSHARSVVRGSAVAR